MKPAREEEEEDTIEESRDDMNAIDERPQENRQEITAGEQQAIMAADCIGHII